MVQIPMKIRDPSSPLPRWGLIELQGDLKHRNGEDIPLNGLRLGDLHFTKDGTPIMIIGHHVLYGKVLELDKPFLMVRRQRSPDGTTFDIEAIIKSKLIFKTRPKPIVMESTED